MDNMDWNDARYFVFAVRERSFLKAGAELGVSHTTVARRIQAFEREWGVRLLERLPEGLVPTVAGERFLERALRVEREFLAMEREIVGLDAGLVGQLRITAPYLISRYLLPALCREFRRLHPEIELQCIAAFERFNLSRREADIAIRATSVPPETAVGRMVAHLSWSLYVAESEAEAWSDADASPCYIGLDDERPEPEWLVETFPQASLGARANDPMLLIDMVEGGMGGAVLPDFVGASVAGLVRLCRVPSWDCGLWLLTHRDLAQGGRVRAFNQFAADWFKRKNLENAEP